MTGVDETAAALARLYDVDLLEDPGDLDLYLATAARVGVPGPILEFGVGSGRVAVPLAAEGYAVTGLDRDPAMLLRARDRAKALGAAVARRLTLVEGDVRRPPVGIGRFAMAFVALNSLLVFGSRSDQRSVVRSLADHLEPGGVLLLDVWLPDAEDLGRYDGRLGLEYVRRDPDTDNLVTKTASALHDAATATVELTNIFDEGRQGEPASRWIRTDRLRLVGADDLRDFAEAAGLVVELVAGDYDLGPLAPGGDRAILLARREGQRSATSGLRTGRRAANPSGGASGTTGGRPGSADGHAQSGLVRLV